MTPRWFDAAAILGHLIAGKYRFVRNATVDTPRRMKAAMQVDDSLAPGPLM